MLAEPRTVGTLCPRGIMHRESAVWIVRML